MQAWRHRRTGLLSTLSLSRQPAGSDKDEHKNEPALFTMSSFVGLVKTGRESVGQVAGTDARHLTWIDYRSARWNPNGNWVPGADDPALNSEEDGEFPLANFADVLQLGWDAALSRLTLAAAAIGADGVVGVQASERRWTTNVREFSFLGTAVRSRGSHRHTPFTTTLTGMEIVKLESVGLAPAHVVVATGVSMRRSDTYSSYLSRQSVTTDENPAHTQLLLGARRAVRIAARRRVQHLGSYGLLLAAPIETRVVRLRSRGTDFEDHMAEAVLFGDTFTGIARSGPPGLNPTIVKTLTDPASPT